MSLNTWEQQALDSITDRLADSDPKLAALLTGFTQLVAGEEMPLREGIGAASRRATWCPRGKRRHPRGDEVPWRAGRMSRRLGFQWAALLLSLVTAVTVIAITMALNHGRSQSPCTPWYMACTNSALVHSSRPASHKRVTSQAAQQGAVGTSPLEIP